MPDTPLNPDALEAAENMFIFMCADGYTPKAEDAAESLVSAYLAVAQPVTQKLTDAEWQAFQAIPDQGYSHRAWVDARIAERVATVRDEAKAEALEEAADWVRDNGGDLVSRGIEEELTYRANQYKENQ